MVRNEEKHQLATHYRKRGFTYVEIAKLCGVSKSTVSAWFANKRFSQQVKQVNLQRAAKDNAKRLQLLNKAKQTAQRSVSKAQAVTAALEFKQHQSEPLFVQGLALLCVAGIMNSSGLIQFSSPHPAAHRAVASFLNRYGKVSSESLRFWLTISEKDNQLSLQKNWQRQLKFPSTSWRPARHLKNTPVSHGTGTLRVYSTDLVVKLAVYQEKWQKMALKSQIL